MLSKIFEGLVAKVLLGLLIATLLGGGIIWAGKNRQIKKQAADIALYQGAIRDYKAAVATLKGSQAQLEAGVAICNASVTNLAATRDALGRAGVAALQEVQKADASVARRNRDIDAMPKATCEDAFQILKSH